MIDVHLSTIYYTTAVKSTYFVADKKTITRETLETNKSEREKQCEIQYESLHVQKIVPEHITGRGNCPCICHVFCHSSPGAVNNLCHARACY